MANYFNEYANDCGKDIRRKSTITDKKTALRSFERKAVSGSRDINQR
jgi:hypothetical protein